MFGASPSTPRRRWPTCPLGLCLSSMLEVYREKAQDSKVDDPIRDRIQTHGRKLHLHPNPHWQDSMRCMKEKRHSTPLSFVPDTWLPEASFSSLSTIGSSHREGGSCQADTAVGREWHMRAILATTRVHKITELGTM